MNIEQTVAVNAAFSKQSAGYDDADQANIVLRDLREQVYKHVRRYLRPESHILELNAGTGIDALKFVSEGHHVTATDLSDGMVAQIKTKIARHQLHSRLKCLQLSYDNINILSGEKFDFVFSNFGGLNCIQDLRAVTHHLPQLLVPGAIVTWVIMPPVCLWELAGIFAGHGHKAFRRLQKNGTRSHLEGSYFTTYYHSLPDIKSAFGKQFRLIESEGLGALSPPPHRGDIPVAYPRLYNFLTKADRAVRSFTPFNRWADHIIVTFRFKP
jgi:ubiquinone/menaquinone biosynthesis C-methylase UbiE